MGRVGEGCESRTSVLLALLLVYGFHPCFECEGEGEKMIQEIVMIGLLRGISSGIYCGAVSVKQL